MMITEHEYALLTGAVRSGPSALWTSVYENCKGSGLCDANGQITEQGLKAVQEYESEKRN